MKLARIATIVLALCAGFLAGCQTDGAGASGTTSSSGSSGGY
jgi:predicted small secreted protein